MIGSQLMQHDLDARPLYGRYEVPQLDISRFSLRPEYIELATKSAERYLAVDLTADVPKNILANFDN